MKKFDWFLGVALMVMLTGCVTTGQARSVKPTGFLGGSAALLQKGAEGDALLVYRKKDADWKTYHAVLLDPITIWGAKSSTIPKDQQSDFQKLVDEFDAMLREKLSKDYTITDTASAGTMRIQIAIIDGERANETLKVAKGMIPYGGYADQLWTFATGKPAFAGEVSIEYMVKDSVSQELLAAGADRRIGGNETGKTTGSWADVQSALTYWSNEAVYRLCLDRGETKCIDPSPGY